MTNHLLLHQNKIKKISEFYVIWAQIKFKIKGQYAEDYMKSQKPEFGLCSPCGQYVMSRTFKCLKHSYLL